MSTSAPGKLIIAGEYAVLRGDPAIVMAIDRRAIATEVDEPEPLSPFLAEVAGRVGRDPGRLRVDTSAFATDGRKLGLGSSAAATVAFAGALAPELELTAIHELAHQAHGAVSARAGARGSGVDVAVSVWGGVIRATPRGEACPAIEPIALPADLVWVAVDSGSPADTRDLVSRVMARAKDRDLDRIARACADLAAASTAAEAVEAIEAGMTAIAELGEATGVALLTEPLGRIARVARRHGGAAKPTGAAGGDMAFAGFVSEAAARQFCDDLKAAGISSVPLALDPHGLLQNPRPGGKVLRD